MNENPTDDEKQINELIAEGAEDVIFEYEYVNPKETRPFQTLHTLYTERTSDTHGDVFLFQTRISIGRDAKLDEHHIAMIPGWLFTLIAGTFLYILLNMFHLFCTHTPNCAKAKLR